MTAREMECPDEIEDRNTFVNVRGSCVGLLRMEISTPRHRSYSDFEGRKL